MIRVLVLGSGPVAATRTFMCPYGAVGEAISCDAFSRLYRQLAAETGFTPPDGFPESLGVDRHVAAAGLPTNGLPRARLL